MNSNSGINHIDDFVKIVSKLIAKQYLATAQDNCLRSEWLADVIYRSSLSVWVRPHHNASMALDQSFAVHKKRSTARINRNNAVILPAIWNMIEAMLRTAPILFAAFWISLASVATGAFALTQQADPNFRASRDSGLWQFRTMDGGAADDVSDRICISDTKKLAQIRHLKLQCSQKLLKSNAASMVISYSCAGHGHGMTTIRKETSRLIHIDTQGISDGSPFAFSLEARRLGDCP